MITYITGGERSGKSNYAQTLALILSSQNELEKWLEKPHPYLIIISNEIGMGVHAQTETGRKFVEIQGWINQFLAAKADKVIRMISGIPVTLKG